MDERKDTDIAKYKNNDVGMRIKVKRMSLKCDD